MKKVLSFLFLLIGMSVLCQNKQVLYNFAEIPQSLLLNPATKTNYKFHIGVPLLSGFSAEFGSTGFVLSDLFLKDNRPINDKVAEVLKKLKVKDHLKFNSQLEILSAGYRLNEKTYLSFGFYQEIDAISYFPKDVITLLNEGNSAYLNRSFDVSQLTYKVDVFGVLHAGITKRINNKLTLGGRFKIYSSSINAETKNNQGTFRTVVGNDNIYRHYFNNINVNLKTSGIVVNNEIIKEPVTYAKNTLLAGSLGLGIDFGVTYEISKQLEFSGSILDLGFVNQNKNTKITTAKGNFVTEGIEFQYNSSNSIDYWSNLEESFKEKLPIEDIYDSYISLMPTKINAALKYSFGRIRSKYCYDHTFKNYFKSAIGVHLNTVFRPIKPQIELTGFYENSFSNNLHAKLTYTIDEYSFYNIGAGISAQFGKINIYGMVDNILEFNDIASAKSISVQMGINLIFN